MIDFYTWNTPNGQKIAIMLEELQLPYQIHPIDIKNNAQFSADFLKINPNNKIPAITDQDDPNHKAINIFESGAILIYLAEKTGRLLPSDPRTRVAAIEWLMFQAAGAGPMFGQLHYFLHVAPEAIPHVINRYTEEVKRLYRVMDKRLETHLYFADEYSIADIAIFPWLLKYPNQGIEIDSYPNVKRFIHDVSERQAVQQAMKIMEAVI